jgi:hypothetical protein
VVEFGGPCRGRTYGPLIKSEVGGVAQVVDDVGNPLNFTGDSCVLYSALLVAVRFVSPQIVGFLNTYITPAKITSDPPYPIIFLIPNPTWEVIRLAHQFLDGSKLCPVHGPKIDGKEASAVGGNHMIAMIATCGFRLKLRGGTNNWQCLLRVWRGRMLVAGVRVAGNLD